MEKWQSLGKMKMLEKQAGGAVRNDKSCSASAYDISKQISNVQPAYEKSFRVTKVQESLGMPFSR